MKKVLTLTLVMMLAVSITACSQNTSNTAEAIDRLDTELSASADTLIDNADANPSAEEGLTPVSAAAETGNGILIVYFTMPETAGVDAVAGASRVVRSGEVVGNTQLVAQWISQATEGELFAIQTVQAYPGDHDALVDFADEELAASARPELATHIENLDGYDTIFIGYPNWWGDLPMPLYTFFEEYDFAGKTIIPFNTHGGSGLSRTIQTIAELEPKSTVVETGFTVSRDSVSAAQEDVNSWLRELNYLD